MFVKIRKRSGEMAPFDGAKISAAITKAGVATGEFDGKEAKKLTKLVLTLAAKQIKTHIPKVEEIQDIVERVLLDSPFRATAKAYIIYRQKHAEMRELAEKQRVDLMDQYLDNLDWQVNENSNMSYSLQGLNNYVAAEISKSYWLNKIYPPEIRTATVEGDMHIHDLQILSSY